MELEETNNGSDKQRQSERRISRRELIATVLVSSVKHGGRWRLKCTALDCRLEVARTAAPYSLLCHTAIRGSTDATVVSDVRSSLLSKVRSRVAWFTLPITK